MGIFGGVYMIKSDVQLDAKGLACPMPIVRTKKVMATVEEGQVLEVQATDKGSVADLAAWSKTVGHQYIGSTEDNGVFYHYIRKGKEEELTASASTKTISVDDAMNGSGILLDVREEAEYKFGHIPGAISIPMRELTQRMNELDKEQSIYVICRSGTRSDLAVRQLEDAGFTKTYNVVTGMISYNGPLNKEI